MTRAAAFVADMCTMLCIKCNVGPGVCSRAEKLYINFDGQSGCSAGSHKKQRERFVDKFRSHVRHPYRQMGNDSLRGRARLDTGWVPDSQMIWSDCYATLALAAVNTKRIRLGTGVAIAGTRIAPVTAHSIASIAQLAPGRVFLGIGTGHTAMRVIGQDPMPPREFREYLRVVRTLLEGKEVDYTYAGKTREIKFIHRDRYSSTSTIRFRFTLPPTGPRLCARPANTATAGSR